MPFTVTDPLGLFAWAFLALQVAVLWGVMRSRKALNAGETLPEPNVLFPSLAVQLSILLAVSLAAAYDAGIRLIPASQSVARALVWAPLALLLLLASVPLLWRVTPLEQRKRNAGLLPRNAKERAWMLVVSLIAGLSEEIAWRAVLPALLWHLTGSEWIAIGLSALSFGFAHWTQGTLAIAAVFGFALVFHGLVALTGGLPAAIAVHALYDAIVATLIGPALHRRAA
jgi:membrane protease YdiL (CAAX protease family)